MDSSTGSTSSDRTSLATSGSEASVRGWGGKAEFMLTSIGYCIGLGNVWRFPYLVYANGGGAFLIPYLLCLVFLGLPMFFHETALGQFTSLSSLGVWKVSPIFKGLGFSMNIITVFVVIYYNVIVSWILYYLFASFTTQLPWDYCDHCWNTDACVDEFTNDSDIINGTINGLPIKTPSEEYYYNNVLQISDGLETPGHVVWQLLLLLLLTWVIVFFVLINGMKSVGKMSYFISTFPYILMTIMLIEGAMLPGALEGVKYYIIPDWEKLLDPAVWGAAATQIFYSTGICFGSLIAMSSYNKFNHNILRDAIIIPCINCLTSIYVGFAVFCVLGYISYTQNIPIDQVATEGPGLIFVVYPEGLATMPGAPFWSVLFFLMMSTIGFSSQFSMAEGVCCAFIDEYPRFFNKRRRPLILRFCYCLFSFLLGIPMVTQCGFYLFTLMDAYSASYALFVTGFFELIAIEWVYGYNNFADDISMMIGKRPSAFFWVMWKYGTPILTATAFLFLCVQVEPLTLGSYVYPWWANMLGWLMVALPLSAIFGWMIGYNCHFGAKQVWKKNSEELPSWGPALAENRSGRYEAHELAGLKLDMDHEMTGDEDSTDTTRFTPPLVNSYDNTAYEPEKGANKPYAEIEEYL